MYLRNCRNRKTLLDKCDKNRVSRDHSTDNIASGSKHCRNLNESTFTIFINPCEDNYVGKNLF